MQYSPNVLATMNRAAMLIGQLEAELWRTNLTACCLPCESPIEQMFYMAFVTMARMQQCDVQTGHDPFPPSSDFIRITPQKTFGNYRVDFYVEVFAGNEISHTLIVELDGHKFHDKDEKQRRYEKVRDRHFSRLGIHVLHFTGKEVTDNPFKVAKEVLYAAMNVDEEKLVVEM